MYWYSKFFVYRKIVSKLNRSPVALIPKIPWAHRPEKFCPVVPCSCLCEFIFKSIADTMKTYPLNKELSLKVGSFKAVSWLLMKNFWPSSFWHILLWAWKLEIWILNWNFIHRSPLPWFPPYMDSKNYGCGSTVLLLFSLMELGIFKDTLSHASYVFVDFSSYC